MSVTLTDIRPTFEGGGWKEAWVSGFTVHHRQPVSLRNALPPLFQNHHTLVISFFNKLENSTD